VKTEKTYFIIIIIVAAAAAEFISGLSLIYNKGEINQNIWNIHENRYLRNVSKDSIWTQFIKSPLVYYYNFFANKMENHSKA